MSNGAHAEHPFYPLDCPHCGQALRGDHGPARPVAAHLLRLAHAVAREATAASELALALGLTRNAVTAGMRRAERAGLVTHTVTSTPHRGGRRYLYHATDLLRAYADVAVTPKPTKTTTTKTKRAKTKKGSAQP